MATMTVIHRALFPEAVVYLQPENRIAEMTIDYGPFWMSGVMSGAMSVECDIETLQYLRASH